MAKKAKTPDALAGLPDVGELHDMYDHPRYVAAYRKLADMRGTMDEMKNALRKESERYTEHTTEADAEKLLTGDVELCEVGHERADGVGSPAWWRQYQVMAAAIPLQEREVLRIERELAVELQAPLAPFFRALGDRIAAKVTDLLQLLDHEMAVRDAIRGKCRDYTLPHVGQPGLRDHLDTYAINYSAHVVAEFDEFEQEAQTHESRAVGS